MQLEKVLVKLDKNLKVIKNHKVKNNQKEEQKEQHKEHLILQQQKKQDRILEQIFKIESKVFLMK